MSIDSKIQQLAGRLKKDADNHILWKYVADLDDMFFLMLDENINIDEWIDSVKILGYNYYKHNFIIYDINKDVIYESSFTKNINYADDTLNIILRDIRKKKLERICNDNTI